MEFKKIIKAHFNELMNKEEELKNTRMKICEACPLYKEGKFGPICNSKLFINPLNNDTSFIMKEGYTQGCGCRLTAKTRSEEAHCPVNKW